MAQIWVPLSKISLAPKKHFFQIRVLESALNFKMQNRKEELGNGSEKVAFELRCEVTVTTSTVILGKGS